MRVYYWTDKKNFGDLLLPLLIKKFCNISTQLTGIKSSELVMVGSILEQLPSNYSGIIAGCGKLHEDKITRFDKAKILAVRGPLTAKALGLDPTKILLADPGLIADELVGYRDKEYDLGIVPHWTDTTLEHDPRFLQYNPKIIRVSDDPLKVIEEIAKCKKIVSSSLHGIILADAYNIPRRIEIAPRMLSHSQHEGGLFKWKDYSASIGMDLEIGLTQEADKFVIIEKQYALFDLFEKIKTLFS